MVMATVGEAASRRRHTIRPLAGGVLSSVLAIFFFGPSMAGDWSIVPRIDVKEYYSDNISLAQAGQERHDFVTSVAPALSIRGLGARVTGNLDYRYQTVDYARNTQARSTNHQLVADGTAELLKDQIFLDASATHRQENVDSTGRITADNIAASGNRTNVTTMSISPYHRHRFGRWAEGESRYTYDQLSSDGASSDSSSNGVSLSLNSGSRFNKMPWNVQYSNRKVDRRDGGSDSQFRRIEGELRYKFNRAFGVLGNVGHDKNEFASSQSSTGGVRWRLGGTWDPSPRTSLEAGYGKQFSGSNYFLDFSHASRRSIWSASFSEAVSDSRSAQLARQVVPLTDAFGQPLDPGGELTDINSDTNAATINDETVVSTSFAASYSLQGKRTNYNLGVFHAETVFQASGDQESVFGGNASVSHKMSRRTTARLRGNLRHRESLGNSESTNYRMSLSLTHKVFENVSGTLASAEYDETRLSLALRVRF